VRLDGSVLTARELRVELASGAAIIEGVSLELAAGDILGLVGESGSGKTTTARSLFGYADRGVSRQSGQITVAGEQLDTADSLRRARGRLLSYVPQNPGTSLNPSLRVLAAIEDTLAVGDGANDLDMIRSAGLGVAYHAKPVVAGAAPARIDHGDLRALLYLQGYRDDEIVDA